MLVAGANKYANRISARGKVVGDAYHQYEQNQNAIRNRQNAIAMENRSESSSLAETFDDFDLNWNSEMLSEFQKSYMAQMATGQTYRANISVILADKYAYKKMLDLNRVRSQAAAVSGAHEERRAAQRGAINHLANERSVIEGRIRSSEAMANAAVRMTYSHETRLVNVLSRIDQLNQALAEDYQPSLKQNRVEIYQGKTNEQFGPFHVQTPIWRVDWYINRHDDSAGFTADLVTATTGKAFTRIEVVEVSSR